MGDIGSPVPAASHSASHAADAPAAAATAVNPEAPHLTIAYHNVSASVQVSPADSRVKTIFTPLVELSKILTGSAATTTFWRVHEASGVIRPGTMTLIIAPPGHGKSSLLRLLADRLKPDHNDNNKGGCGAGSAVKDVGVRYNGLTKAQAAAEGCSVRRMCHLVEQVDEHLPLLTVRETLDFAHECTSMVRDPARVDSVIRMLGLTECQNTILGDALTRGVSGGQKRRVTVGEMLVGDARAVFLDEYTNGLDTATSEDITRGLRKWAHKSNGSVVTTAQQPTPGLYAEYDDIIIMSNADVIYHGPREDVVPFFASMGFNCPDDVDVCDFIIDCVSQPRVALQRLQHNERSDAKAAKAAGAPAPDYSGVRRSTKGELALAATPCVTAAQMLTHYHASPFYLRILSDLKPHFPDVELLTAAPAPDAVTVQPLLPGEHAKRVYSVAYVQSVTSLLAMVFFREVRVLRRSNMLVIPRFLQDILLGLIIGSFFYMVPEDSFFLRIAALLVLTAQCGLSNMAALPSAVDDSRIIFRQAAAGMYPPWAYVVAASLMSLPILIVECILMGLPVYFMSDCVSEASAFLTFFAILLVQSLNVSVFYRLISSGAADEPAAHSITGPITCIAFVLGGFFVSTSSMPVWYVRRLEFSRI
jgi:ABC-type multidrug transport system ATPase subunit